MAELAQNITNGIRGDGEDGSACKSDALVRTAATAVPESPYAGATSDVVHAPGYSGPVDAKGNVAPRRQIWQADRRERGKKRRLQRYPENAVEYQRFMMALMDAMLVTGYPSHRIHECMNNIASVFDLHYAASMVPRSSIMAFGRWGEPRLVQADSRIQVSRIRAVHAIYRDVFEDRMFPSKARRALKRISCAPLLYANWFTQTLSFVTTLLIAGLAFGGSPNDMWIAGIVGYIVKLAQTNPTSVALSSFGNDVYLAVIIVCLARLLDDSFNHKVCFSTLSSSTIIPLLPGGLILQGSLDVAGGNIQLGGSKVVSGLVQGVVLGFGMAFGSDIYYSLNTDAVIAMRLRMPAAPAQITMQGLFEWDTHWGDPLITGGSDALNDGAAVGIFTFSDKVDNEPLSPESLPMIGGCYRDPNWSWFFQPLKMHEMVPLAPLFVFMASINDQQWLWDIDLVVMTLFGTVAFWASRLCKEFLGIDRPDYTALIGSFAIGILGNLYARLFDQPGWTMMLSGINLLVPDGLATAGGLSGVFSTYGGSSLDEYKQSLLLARKLLGVVMGVVVGVYLSAQIVYVFDRKAKRPLRMIF